MVFNNYNEYISYGMYGYDFMLAVAVTSYPLRKSNYLLTTLVKIAVSTIVT